MDDNCNGLIDESADSDGDGYRACVDCDDADYDINPGASELACDGIDNNCDGSLHALETDGDGDGFTVCTDDCDDANPDAWPGAPETACDLLDLDCDGLSSWDPLACGDDDDAFDDDDSGNDDDDVVVDDDDVVVDDDDVVVDDDAVVVDDDG